MCLDFPDILADRESRSKIKSAINNLNVIYRFLKNLKIFEEFQHCNACVFRAPLVSQDSQVQTARREQG